ncbi:hypothetical protein GF327_03470 [Candidatus Woesearchaeota archaeon]|nr:hypothetical protein [Candidatus Woesearchaeota archaeon]
MIPSELDYCGYKINYESDVFEIQRLCMDHSSQTPFLGYAPFEKSIFVDEKHQDYKKMSDFWESLTPEKGFNPPKNVQPPENLSETLYNLFK